MHRGSSRTERRLERFVLVDGRLDGLWSDAIDFLLTGVWIQFEMLSIR